MIEEHDRIVLNCDLPDEGLADGDIGTVVHIAPGHAGYIVEFMTLDGETVAIVTLDKTQVRPVRPREMQHARPLGSTA